MEQLLGIHHRIPEHLAVETAVFYWSVMTLSHKGKPQSNHFQIQIHSACVSHSHMATKVEKEAVCVSPSRCTTSIFGEEGNLLRDRQMAEVELGWVGLVAVQVVQLGLAWVRQFQVPVIRSSQPNNLKLPTSHGSALGSAKSSQGRQSGWNLGKHFKG